MKTEQYLLLGVDLSTLMSDPELTNKIEFIIDNELLEDCMYTVFINDKQVLVGLRGVTNQVSLKVMLDYQRNLKNTVESIKNFIYEYFEVMPQNSDFDVFHFHGW